MTGPLEERVRARAATLAAAARRLNSGAAAPFSLAFMTDRKRGPDAMLVAAALPAGAAIIIRDYDDPARAEKARALSGLCAARGVVLLVGGDGELAREIGADGVHLRSDQLTGERPAARLVSASCHGAEELERAARLGADIALLGPAFPTASHPGAPSLGPMAFRALAAAAGLPVLALGGVDETNADELAGPNVTGFAAIGAFAPGGE